MPKIIIQADGADGEAPNVTLTERIVAEHVRDHHYAKQLIERLLWAAADAENLEQAVAPGP